MTISNIFALLARVAEQRSGDDQVAGRRDRQEFGQALDDAEDECNENGWMIQRRRRADACERASIVHGNCAESCGGLA